MVGLGKVGQGYDYDSPNDAVILTHATALKFHPGFELIGGVDQDPVERERFKRKFSRPSYSSIEDLFSDFQPNIMSIAVPTSLHREIFCHAIHSTSKAVVLEKPVANSLDDAIAMQSKAESSGCPVLVNYLRRFNPAIGKLKQMIERGQLGQIYKGTAWYTKGIIENGSHFVDLFQWLLGEQTSIQVMNAGRKWDNHDPEPDLCIRFGSADIYLLAGREENYCMGRFELVGTKGMIHYEDGKPIKTYFSQEDPIYAGYRNIGNEHNIANNKESNIWYAYDNLANHLLNGEKLESSLKTGIKTLKTIEKIIALWSRNNE